MQEAAEIIGPDLNGFILAHPYTNSAFVGGMRDGQPTLLNVLDSKEDEMQFREHIFKRIDEADPLSISMLVNKPYKLCWFKLVKDLLSDKEYGNLLSEIWVQSEHPNDDANVSTIEAIQYFRTAKKHCLMTKEELEVWKSFPQTLTVYRGVSKGRNPDGLSYTTDLEKAKWFQSRFADKSDQGFLITKTIDRSCILAYFDRRNEAEVVVDVTRI